MNNVSKLRNACFAWLTVALLAVAAAACEDDKTSGGDLRLYYPAVSNIGPSMSFISGIRSPFSSVMYSRYSQR